MDAVTHSLRLISWHIRLQWNMLITPSPYSQAKHFANDSCSQVHMCQIVLNGGGCSWGLTESGSVWLWQWATKMVFDGIGEQWHSMAAVAFNGGNDGQRWGGGGHEKDADTTIYSRRWWRHQKRVAKASIGVQRRRWTVMFKSRGNGLWWGGDKAKATKLTASIEWKPLMGSGAGSGSKIIMCNCI